jgi:hypothetical protein
VLLSAAVIADTVGQVAERPLSNVVRVIAFDRAGQSFGSGSFVETFKEYGAVVTNRHVIAYSEGLVHIHFPNGFSTFGAVVKSDAKADLALVVISKPPESVPVLNIAAKAVMPGEVIWVAGYGNGQYRIAQGKCTRYMTLNNTDYNSRAVYDIMEVMIAARYGDSGGPILNTRGELAGVLFGSDMIQFTAGSYSGKVREFLGNMAKEMQRLPDRPETYFATIESDGPRFSLQYSSTLVPSFDRRTNTHTQSNNRLPAVPLPPEAAVVNSITIPKDVKANNGYLAAATPNDVQPAVLSEMTGKVGSQYLVPSIVQTGLSSVSEGSKAKPSVVKPRQYGMKIFADKQDLHWAIFLTGNFIFGIGLVTLAVRLLRRQ